MKKVIVRLDDISWDMNYDKFTRLKGILCKHGIRPIIGVIPENRDEKLKDYRKQASKEISENDFWSLVKKLQDEDGWEIALHGCYHAYTTENAGMLGLNKRSEYAGIKYEDQHNMIEYGKTVLEKHGLRISSFMAPAHSFDINTINALKANQICCITDGYALFPYIWHGCLFVPQVSAMFSSKGIGYSTICIHLNEWDNEKFQNFERFIKQNENSFICFRDAVNAFVKDRKAYWVLLNKLYSLYYSVRRRLSRIKHGKG